VKALEPIEGAGDHVFGPDRVVDEALLAVGNPFLPITHVLFENVLKLAAG
jgi:hypothetical protein